MALQLLQLKSAARPRSQRAQMIAALLSMLERLDEIDAECGTAFPLYAPTKRKRWQTSQGGSWSGGFWAGCWWLKAKHSESAGDRAKADAWCRRLRGKLAIDSCYRSFIFRYGAVFGAALFGSDEARSQAEAAAQKLVQAYDAELLAIPLGTGLGSGELGKRAVAIDSFAPLVDLLAHNGNAGHAAIARRHADTLMTVCMEASGAFHAEAHFIERQFHAGEDAGDWSRGQAWGMLGLARAAAHWGEPYLSAAEQSCRYWRQSRPLPLPPNRLSEPVGLRDPSAAVVAALAMASLSELSPNSDFWRRTARQTLMSVVQSSYFRNGAFDGCCYAIKPGQTAMVETPWGHFLLMSALDAMFEWDVEDE
jgi:unsaturated chondroitin disaccharide hydrolase